MSDKHLKKNYGVVVEGPMGLQMPERVARSIEALAKDLPRGDEYNYRRLAKATSDFRVEDGERADVSFITTDDIDRDREVVLPKGIDKKNYNGVVTFAHRYDALPVGSNMWIKPQETDKGMGLVAKTKYPTKPADWGDTPWMPSAVLHLMQQDPPTCTGKSIGFLPLTYREPTPKEIEAKPEWGIHNVWVIEKAALLEYAVAPVPCNPMAEMQTVSKCMTAGGIDKTFADLWLREAKRLLGDAGAELEEPAPVTAAAKAIGFVTPATLKAAIANEMKALMSDGAVKQVFQEAVRDAFDRVTGKV